MAASRRVSFRNFAKYADSQKDAYEWLLDKFLSASPGILDVEDNRRLVCEGRGRRYLAKRAEDLWERSPHLFDERLFKKMSGGWYANTNLDEATKLTVLRRFSKIAGFTEGKDWTWGA